MFTYAGEARVQWQSSWYILIELVRRDLYSEKDDAVYASNASSEHVLDILTMVEI